MNFIKSALPPDPLPTKGYFFIFSNNRILIHPISENDRAIPCMKIAGAIAQNINDPVFFGTLQNLPCYFGGMAGDIVPPGHDFINLRSFYTMGEEIFWQIAGYARQLYDWNINFKFCGRCGTPTNQKRTEFVRICPACDLHNYPRISPAIITAIVTNDKILLARGVNFPNKKMFSVLAGFVEPGESLEDCVRREVFEEVGIRVKNITYFKSQPWPFPDSLMIGFTADYDSGQIAMDRSEVLDADWFDAKHLPMVPEKKVLAGELIHWFVESQKT